MFPLKEPDVRFRIQVVAPTPERALELQWCIQAALEHDSEPPQDDADKILTTDWLATAKEGLQFFKEITKTEDSLIETPR